MTITDLFPIEITAARSAPVVFGATLTVTVPDPDGPILDVGVAHAALEKTPDVQPYVAVTPIVKAPPVTATFMALVLRLTLPG